MDKRNQKGQALLIIVLIVAAVLSVGGAIFFESITQSKITKLQEESARALAVAENLAEEALKKGQTVSLQADAGGGTPGFTGEAKIVETTGTAFTTPLLFNDSQATIYVAKFVTDDAVDDDVEIQNGIRTLLNGGSSPAAESVNMYVAVQNSADLASAGFFNPNCPEGMVLELGFVNISSSPQVKYRFIDCSGNLREVDSAKTVNMGQYFNSPIPAHLILVRVLYKGSNTFPGVILKLTRNGVNWPSQGKVAESAVRTASGTTQTLRLFQSYFQIPASFFVTSANDSL